MRRGGRKRSAAPSQATGGATKRRRGARVEEATWDYSSDEDAGMGYGSDDGAGGADASSDDASDAEADLHADETADEKKLRLAKELLAKLSSAAGEESDSDSGSEGDDAMAKRLRRNADTVAGMAYHRVAARFKGWKPTSDSITAYRGHKLPPTCVTLTADDRVAFTGGKDCCVIRWDVETGQKMLFKGRRPTSWAQSRGKSKAKQLSGSGTGGAAVAGTSTNVHTDTVMAVAASSDGRLLATGSLDRSVCVWDVRTSKVVETFTGHRDGVSSLAFRYNSHTLFSGALDRTVKVWNLDEMAYVDTLYGHQSQIYGIDSLARERAVSCGADATSRMWKVVDESQLVFRGTSACMDCVRMIDEKYFVTGAQGGELALWFVGKKKPAALVPIAHTSGDGWISSLSSWRGTDLLASGSNDGYVRLWEVDTDRASTAITPVAEVPMAGFVNGLDFARSGRFFVAAVGQEHRLGRWWKQRGVRDGLRVVRMPERDSAAAAAEEEEEEDEVSDDDDASQSSAGDASADEEPRVVIRRSRRRRGSSAAEEEEE